LLLVDVLTMRQRVIALRRDPACPLCGTGEITTLQDYEAFCGLRETSAAPAAAAPALTGAPRPAVGPVPQLAPATLAEWYASGRSFALVDVREPYEWELARLPSATLLPLGTLAQSAGDVPRDRDVVLLCHHGMRSQQAAQLLQSLGVTRVFNLSGGIDRWSREVDPGVPRY
jgi:adenylyltransferase/sulfurtransferase